MRSIDNSFYNSKSWRKCKESYLESVNRLCEICLSKGMIVPARIVHHKIHLTEDNYKDSSISLNFENLQAVCQNCHNEIHFGKKQERRYKIINGELVILDDPSEKQ